MTENNTPLSDIPLDWIEKWQPIHLSQLPLTWEDDEHEYQPIPRQAEITEKNQQTLEKTLYPISMKYMISMSNRLNILYE